MRVMRPYRNRVLHFPAISLIFLLMHQGAVAQELNAVFETQGNKFLIGQHIPVTLKVTAERNTVVQWPVFRDTLPAGLIILRKEPVDTLPAESGMVAYVQKLFVTVFDSGTYAVEPMRIFYSNPGSSYKKESYTPPLILTISLVKVSSDDEIRDISPPFGFPVTLRELLPYLVILIVVAAIIVVVIRFLRNRKRRRKSTLPAAYPLPAVQLAPWQLALEALGRLSVPSREDSEIKIFYEEVSGIVRQYLRDGLMVNAPELTTRQVMRRMGSRKDITGACKDTLGRILQVSDMVKFARFLPDISDRYTMVEDAVRFVTDTAPAFLDPEAIQPVEGETR